MASTWKTVRVFISSTFRDMHAEWDHLVKVVFPRLRRCEERRLHLADNDLRWGVTEAEANNGKAIDICLKEIDGSRPFFSSRSRASGTAGCPSARSTRPRRSRSSAVCKAGPTVRSPTWRSSTRPPSRSTRPPRSHPAHTPSSIFTRTAAFRPRIEPLLPLEKTCTLTKHVRQPWRC